MADKHVNLPQMLADRRYSSASPAGPDESEGSLHKELQEGLRVSQLPGLDGMRAIGALLVVLYHYGVPYVNGGFGVLTFFVLSGFLITWLLIKENDRTGTVSLRNFYVRRSLRIFPAFYCYAIAMLALSLATHRQVLWPQAVASLLYVNNYYQALHGHVTSIFSHTWSLGIEEQFYLLWPISFICFSRDYRRLARILAAVILAVWIYRSVLYFGFHVPEVYFYEALDTRADHLLIGSLLAVALRVGLFPGLWTRICRPWAGLVVVGLLVASNVAESLYGHSYRDTLGAVINPLLVAVWIAQLIALRFSLLWGWMNAAWIRYLGRISYSIYLYQAVAMGGPKRLLAAYPAAVQLTGAVLAVVAVASLSYFLIEKPFLAMKARFQRERQTTLTEAAYEDISDHSVPQRKGAYL